MNELEQNNSRFMVATVVMLIALAAIITAGMVLFPLELYVNPNAGLIPGLFNSKAGNIIVFGLLGLLAANMAVYLSRVTTLERERNTILARAAQQAPAATPLRDPRAGGALPPGDR